MGELFSSSWWSMSVRINENRAVFDCDGVVMDFNLGFSRVATDVLGRSASKLCNSYDLSTRYGLTTPEFDRAWSALDDHPHGWRGFEPLPGAAEAIRKFKSEGYEVVVVTGIEERLAESRLANFLFHDLHIDGIECVGHGRASKAANLTRLAPVMYVEDRLHLLYECPFVPHRGWVDHKDEQAGHEWNDSVVRVSSLAEWAEHWQTNVSPQSPQSPRATRAFR